MASMQREPKLFDDWGDIDRSHRKLARRGSYEHRVWVSPSTADRVLARHGLALQADQRPARGVKTPWPAWHEWRPNQLWCWDGSQFERCAAAKHAYAIVDPVSPKKNVARRTDPKTTSRTRRLTRERPTVPRIPPAGRSTRSVPPQRAYEARVIVTV